MDKTIQVLHTYVTRRLLMLLIGFFGLTTIPIIVAAPFSSEPASTVFPALLMLTFCAFFLGAHVKHQLATPEATLVPNYRWPHLLVATLLFFVPVAVGGLLGNLSDLSAAGVTAVAGFAWLSAFHMAAQPNRMAMIGYVVCLATGFVPVMRMMCLQIMEGRHPALAFSLLSIEAAVTVMLFQHLATLSEDDPDYGRVMPMNAWDMKAVEVRRRNRAQLQQSPKFLGAMLNTVSRRLDRITQVPARTQWQRISLLRLSGDWPIQWQSIIAMMLLVEISALNMVGQNISTTRQFSVALTWPILLSLTLGWVYWLPQSQRWSRLGYESLRPTTRPQWVWENGLAMAFNTLQLQGIWLIVQLGLLAMFLPSHWNSPVIPNAMLFLVGTHLLLFGAGAWTASLGSMVWKAVCLVTVLALLQPAWMGLSHQAITLSWQIPAFALSCGLVGVVLMIVSYRRWCRMDLN